MPGPIGHSAVCFTSRAIACVDASKVAASASLMLRASRRLPNGSASLPAVAPVQPS